MVTATEPCAPETVGKPNIRDQVIEWTRKEMDKNGGDLATAATAVIRKVVNSGLSKEFVVQLGEPAVEYVWRGFNKAERNREFAEPERLCSEELGGSPPTTKTDVKRLNKESSILELLVSVGGFWVRIGDLTKKHCHTLKEFHMGQVKGNLREVHFYGTMEERLGARQKVRNVYTAEELKALHNGSFSEEVEVS